MFHAKTKRSIAMAAAVIALLMPAAAGAAFFRPDVRPGYGVTRVGWLSDYHAPLKESNLDAPVYYLEGAKPGATMLMLGGTHPRELAGHTAALVAVENAKVTEGRLIVIPALNASGYGVHDLSTNVSRFHRINCRSGVRYLPYGDRRIDKADQAPDPEQYRHQSGMTIPGSKGGDGMEMRNINRSYPGLAAGSSAQQVAYAVMEMIRREKVVLDVDMHESDTPTWYVERENGKPREGGRLAYMLVCNPRGEALEMGAEAVMDASAELGMRFKVEPSNPAFRGLSHLEIGNASDCLSFLFETPNPGQDTGWRDRPDVMNDILYPLKHRVGLHLDMYQRLVNIYNESHEEKLVIENLPGYVNLMSQGCGAWLN